MKDITILPELKDLIPPLSPEEYEQLEKNCIINGIREPLSLWKKDDELILIDGHNRYKIAQEHNLDYSITEYYFDSITDVKKWIIENQIGRRNLSKFQIIELILPLKEELAAQAKDNQRGGQGGLLLENSTKANTRKTLAEMAGVSENTVHRAEVILQDGDEDLIGQLHRGEKSINAAFLQVTKEKKAKEREAKAKAAEERKKAEDDEKPQEEVRDLYDVIFVYPPWSNPFEPNEPVKPPFLKQSASEIASLELPMLANLQILLYSLKAQNMITQ